jgi:hypothetical protein
LLELLKKLPIWKALNICLKKYKPRAYFMYELAQKQEIPSGLSWISSLPESNDRAKYILNYLKG